MQSVFSIEVQRLEVEVQRQKSESRNCFSITKQDGKHQQQMWMMIGHWLSRDRN